MITEAESAALREYLDPGHPWTASELALTEVVRACVRAGGERAGREARDHLEPVDLLVVDRAILRIAAALAPGSLRSLDAIQVASALQIPDPALVFVAYDQRGLEAAHLAGLRTASPGVEL